MKSNTQADKLSVILYEGQKAPRYFEFSKSFFRFLLFSIPTISIICLLLVGAGAIYFKQIRIMAERKEPAIIKKLNLKNELLIQREQELLKLNQALEKKLTLPVEGGTGLATLQTFNSTPGQADRTQQPVFNIEKLEASTEGENLRLNFNVVNITKDSEKLAGYIFVIMKSKDSLVYYPQGSFDTDRMKINFNRGESFATRRFRSTTIRFPMPKSSDNLLFKIIIFSRTGDLIHKVIIPYTLRK
jgi:hypothetical protein